MDGLMAGKRGLIMGVANDHSIAWGIAQRLAEHGAELAFTYQGESFGRRVKPLAKSLGSSLLLPCDVEDIATVDAVVSELDIKWGSLDFLVHAIAFSDKSELKGMYANTTRANFSRTMLISCFLVYRNRGARVAIDEEWWLCDYPDLWRVDPGNAELQRHGRRQGGAGSERALSGERFRPARHPGQRHFGRTGAGHSPAPAFPTRARCSTTSAAMRHCGARWKSRKSAVRRCICCPNYPPG